MSFYVTGGTMGYDAPSYVERIFLSSIFLSSVPTLAIHAALSRCQEAGLE